jgi:hypothetical protein
MSYFFNPGSPRFRRGTVILSTAVMTFAGAHVLMGDFGSQRHIFSGFQNWLIPQIDAAFGLTKEQILAYKAPPEQPTEQWITLKKNDKNPPTSQ